MLDLTEFRPSPEWPIRTYSGIPQANQNGQQLRTTETRPLNPDIVEYRASLSRALSRSFRPCTRRKCPSNLSDLKNRSENSAGRGQPQGIPSRRDIILTILRGNSRSIAQKSGEIWTGQADLQPISVKPDRLLEPESAIPGCCRFHRHSGQGRASRTVARILGGGAAAPPDWARKIEVSCSS